MSAKHPVVAVTGSSGAGTTYVRNAFMNIFRREGMKAAIISGDCFHNVTRDEFKEAVKKAASQGNNNFSHFGPLANDFVALQQCFKEYGLTGHTRNRFYLHNKQRVIDESHRLGVDLELGGFTPWEDIIPDSELLLYEGLHGMVTDKNQNVNLRPHVDFGIGFVVVFPFFTQKPEVGFVVGGGRHPEWHQANQIFGKFPRIEFVAQHRRIRFIGILYHFDVAFEEILQFVDFFLGPRGHPDQQGRQVVAQAAGGLKD